MAGRSSYSAPRQMKRPDLGNPAAALDDRNGRKADLAKPFDFVRKGSIAVGVNRGRPDRPLP